MLGKIYIFLKKMYKYKNFTAIIPAGGKGSRFDKNINKLLYKINNKSIFEIVLNKIILLTNKVVVVTSKINDKELKDICKKPRYKKIQFKFVLQRNANGMAYALKLALPNVKTKNLFIIWADQIAILPETMSNTIDNFIINSTNAIVLTSVKKLNPYTLIIKNKLGKVTDMVQSRESKITKKYGESDCGFFVCNRLILKNFLNKLISSKKIITKKTKEFDFIMSFKFISKNNSITTFPAKYTYEAKGVNTKKDLNYLLRKKAI